MRLAVHLEVMELSLVVRLVERWVKLFAAIQEHDETRPADLVVGRELCSCCSLCAF